MLDYKLLTAFASVIENGGFDRAARSLGLTQSAVSQRIKLLENRLGQPVIVRGATPEPTAMGRKLLGHVTQVNLLEAELADSIPELVRSETKLRVAVNADSLSTWWVDVVADFCNRRRILLDLVMEDQDRGLQRMREGDVAACLCSAESPVQGARSLLVRRMIYKLYANPDFTGRYFKDGLNKQSLCVAPAIVFGRHDNLHEKVLLKIGYHDPYPFHVCPSSDGIVKILTSGVGYGLVPESQVRNEVKKGVLVEIAPRDLRVEVPLYWHYWRQGGILLDELTSVLAQSQEPKRKMTKWL